jgi:hypothetical protein
MTRYFYSFLRDQSGAVTVDWVVLSAAVIGLGGAAMTSIGSGTTSLADCTAATISNAQYAVSFGPAANSPLAWAILAVAENPNRKVSAIKAVRKAMNDNAPSGYTFYPINDYTLSNPLDSATGLPIYTSNDRTTYRIGDEEISVEDYVASGRATEKGGLRFAKKLVEEVLANPDTLSLTSSASYTNAAKC